MSKRMQFGNIRPTMFNTRFTVLTTAARIDEKYRAEYAEYLAGCEEDYRRGYRPEYCEHGTYMWADYDVMCPGCEGGHSHGDGITRMRDAIAHAKKVIARVDEIRNAMETLARIDCLSRENEEKIFDYMTAIYHLEIPHTAGGPLERYCRD